MEFSQAHQVALGAFVIAATFGALAHRARFCAVGAISDWLHFGDTARLRAWFLALGVAVLGVQALAWLTPIEFGASIYLSQRLAWPGHLAGGLLFGVGMTLASGCAQRNLVLAGGGNLKSLVVLLALAVAAYLTLASLLAPLRDAVDAASIDLAAYGLNDQAIPGVIARATGMENAAALETLLALGAGAGIIGFVLGRRAFRRRLDQIAVGVSLGLVVVAGWYLTGVAGAGDADPARPGSYTFVAPFAQMLEYLLTASASSIGFGTAAVLGVLFGSFAHALATGRFRLERFASRGDLAAHAAGGALMGLGGVLAAGCTIGQGVTGLSTLALGSLMTLVAIIFGAVVTMKVQYHLLDDIRLPRALARALAELRPLRRRAKVV